MSRVHEALRRAAENGGPPVTATPTDEAAFQSAWPIAVRDDVHPKESSHAERPEPIAVAEVTGSVKGFAREWRERLVTAPDGNSALVEQFRRLAGSLHQAQAASGIRVVMVTSANPDDGKTLTAVNLALVLSDSYRRRVLLVDADLRRPSIPHVVDLGGGVGLSETLKARTEQKLALVQLTPTLTLLPAGQPVPDPIGGLTSSRMKRILEEAAARFDWVILDAPPVGPVADASLLAEMVDGTVLVIRAARTQHADVQKAIESVGRERILGVVLNAIDKLPSAPYERYYTGGDEQSMRRAEVR